MPYLRRRGSAAHPRRAVRRPARLPLRAALRRGRRRRRRGTPAGSTTSTRGRPTRAETVLLLHGEPSWSYLYRKMIPTLVAAGHRVRRPRPRRLRPLRQADAAAADYTYQRHVDWMREALFDAPRPRGITLVCQDWGGLIGLRLVAEHPERFARVVVAQHVPADRRPRPRRGVPRLAAVLPGGAGVADRPDRARRHADRPRRRGRRRLRRPLPRRVATRRAPASSRCSCRPRPTTPPPSPTAGPGRVLEQFDKPFLSAFSDSGPDHRRAPTATSRSASPAPRASRTPRSSAAATSSRRTPAPSWPQVVARLHRLTADDRAGVSTLRRFLDRTPLAAALVGPDAYVVASNARMEELLGYPPGGLDGVSASPSSTPTTTTGPRRSSARRVDRPLTRRHPRPLPRPAGRRGAGIEVEVATTNLLDDPAMGGILLTARASTSPADPRAGVVRGRRPADDRRGRRSSTPTGAVLYVGAGARADGQPAGERHRRKRGALRRRVRRRGTTLQSWLERPAGRAAARHDQRPGAHRRRGGDLHPGRGPGARTCSTTPSCRGSCSSSRDVTEQRRLEADARLAARLLEASPVGDRRHRRRRRRSRRGTAAAERPSAGPRPRRSARPSATSAPDRRLARPASTTTCPCCCRGGTVELAGRRRAPRRHAPSPPTSSPRACSTRRLLRRVPRLGLDLSTEHDVREALAASEGRWSALARDARARARRHRRRRRPSSTTPVPGYASILGYDPESLVGTSLRELLHPDDRRPARRRRRGRDRGRARATSATTASDTPTAPGASIEAEVTDRRDEPLRSAASSSSAAT